MTWLEGLILGLIQGLTEYLPISSKTHLIFGYKLLNLPDPERYLMFSIILHGGTVLSTLVVFRKDIIELISGFFTFNPKNTDFIYVSKIVLSMVPVAIIGMFFKDQVQSLFDGNLVFIGIMMLVTTGLLTAGHFSKSRNKEITFKNSIWIGIAQAIAVLPGISRSGSTISAGLILGIKREKLAKFSFLMVILPVLGEVVLDVFSGELANQNHISHTSLIVAFLASFISGIIACKWMINLVKKGKLIYFAIYCFVVALISISLGMMK